MPHTFPNAGHAKIDHPEFEYNQIDDSIFIGTDMCCQVHFEEELLQKGISADISLQDERLDAPFGVDYFLWLPTVDHQAPTQKQLELGAETIAALISEEEKVYVHCKNGHGRGPTLVAAYYIQLGMNVDEAIDRIVEKRPTVHMEDVQVQALHEFAKKYSSDN